MIDGDCASCGELWRIVGLMPTIVRQTGGAGGAGGGWPAAGGGGLAGGGGWRKRIRLPSGSSPLKCSAAIFSLMMTVSAPVAPSASVNARPRTIDTPTTSKNDGLMIT